MAAYIVYQPFPWTVYISEPEFDGPDLMAKYHAWVERTTEAIDEIIPQGGYKVAARQSDFDRYFVVYVRDEGDAILLKLRF